MKEPAQNDSARVQLRRRVEPARRRPAAAQFRALEPADPNRRRVVPLRQRRRDPALHLDLLVRDLGPDGRGRGEAEPRRRGRPVDGAARDLLIGKVLGIGLLGLVQLMVMVGGRARRGDRRGPLRAAADDRAAVVLLIVWFVLGYALYSTALGVLGALASRMEEASNASTPGRASSPPSPTSSRCSWPSTTRAATAARIATLLPPVAPMVVPLRAALGAIEPWEIAPVGRPDGRAIWALFVVGGRVYPGPSSRPPAGCKLRDAWRAAAGLALSGSASRTGPAFRRRARRRPSARSGRRGRGR